MRVMVQYLVQFHDESQVLGESGIVMLRDEFGSHRWVQGWYQQEVIECYRSPSGSSRAGGLGVTREKYFLSVLNRRLRCTVWVLNHSI